MLFCVFPTKSLNSFLPSSLIKTALGYPNFHTEGTFLKSSRPKKTHKNNLLFLESVVKTFKEEVYWLYCNVRAATSILQYTTREMKILSI